jgi:hypothetical protein
MLPLEDPAWNQLSHAYGSGSDIPGWIRNVESRLKENQPIDDELWNSIWSLCHQWGTYDGTYAAIPHFVRMCAASPPDNSTRIQLLWIVGWCVACLRLNRTEAAADLIPWFEESIPIARDLIAESLPFVTDTPGSQDNLRNLIAAFATCHGNAPLGFVLFELDAGGFRCDNCREFIQPMESSLNPFWVERKGS